MRPFYSYRVSRLHKTVKKKNDEAGPHTKSARVDKNAEDVDWNTISPTCRLQTIPKTRISSLSKLQNNQSMTPSKKAAAITAASNLFEFRYFEVRFFL